MAHAFGEGTQPPERVSQEPDWLDGSLQYIHFDILEQRGGSTGTAPLTDDAPAAQSLAGAIFMRFNRNA